MQKPELEIKPVTLSDKPILDRYFSQYGGFNSEFTFTNMFMWQKSYNIRYVITNDMLCIFSKHGDGAETVNIPLGNGDMKAAISTLLDYFKSVGQPPLIRLYKEDEKTLLNSLFPNTFVFTEDRNSYDYVYNVQDLIDLPGSRYHAKRNHINRLLANHSFEYKPIDEALKKSCFDLFVTWCESKRDTVPGIDEQYEAVKCLFDNMDTLRVKGGCILIDGQVVAFSFGEALNAEKSIAVIHLEHADANIQGSFPLINQQFLENEWSEFELVNREEDMGLSGLRRAKKSYHPCMMVKKYIASVI